MKKIVVVLAVFCVLGIPLFASGQEESSDQENSQVSIRFGWWGGDSRHKAYMDAAERYMELHPEVEIICEYSGFDGYREKLYTQLAGGNSPQLFQNHYTWLSDQSGWQGSAVVKDLNEYDQYVDTSIYPEGFLEEYTIYDNHLMALPGSINCDAIVVNKAVLDQIDFDYDQVWEFEDVFEFSRELKKVDSSLYWEAGLGAGGTHQYWFIAYLTQKTGLPFATDYKLNYSQEDLMDAFGFFKKYMDEEVIEPIGTLELYTGNPSQNPNWVGGKCGAIFGMLSTLENYINALGDYSSDAEVIRMPLMSDAKDPYYQTKVGQIFSVSASASDSEAAASAQFLNWMNTDPEAGVILKLSRGIPVSQVQKDALNEANLLNPLVTRALQYTIDAGQGLGQGVLIRNKEIETIGDDIFSALAFDKYTPAEAAVEYERLINRKLQELESASK